MNDQELYLVHHGVKGMKWGVRKKSYNPNATVRKSSRTKTFEKLAASGERRAKQQDALYKAYKNPYNKSSADQWRREASANRKAAENSYKQDVFRKTASRAQKKDFKKQTKEYNAKYNKLMNDPNFRAKVINDGKRIAEKYNKVMTKKGIIDGSPYDSWSNERKEQHRKYMDKYSKEWSEITVKSVESAIGKKPTIDQYAKKK